LAVCSVLALPLFGTVGARRAESPFLKDAFGARRVESRLVPYQVTEYAVANSLIVKSWGIEI
jgi:hypothetical protein